MRTVEVKTRESQERAGQTQPSSGADKERAHNDAPSSERSTAPAVPAPKLLKTKAEGDGLDIELLLGRESETQAAHIQALEDLYRRVPASPNWRIDLGPLEKLALPFMDFLLATGRRLRKRGGCLRLAGLRRPSEPQPFFERFVQRCGQEQIEVCSAEPSGRN